jgi:hypothetical protein
VLSSGCATGGETLVSRDLSVVGGETTHNTYGASNDCLQLLYLLTYNTSLSHTSPTCGRPPSHQPGIAPRVNLKYCALVLRSRHGATCSYELRPLLHERTPGPCVSSTSMTVPSEC